MHPIQLYIGTARSLTKEVYGRTIWPLLGIDELQRRKILKTPAVGSSRQADVSIVEANPAASGGYRQRQD
jgi:hypothetical protein